MVEPIQRWFEIHSDALSIDHAVPLLFQTTSYDIFGTRAFSCSLNDGEVAEEIVIMYSSGTF
jgi:hypothetical protein